MLIPALIITITVIFLLAITLSKKMFVLVMIICVAMIVFACTYTVSPHLRQEVNTLFNIEYQHHIIGNIGYRIPLPPRTAFEYRSSNTSAMYITGTSKDDIIKFFGDLSQSIPTVTVETEETLTIVSFYYEQRNIIVEISPSLRQGRWNLYIDVKE